MDASKVGNDAWAFRLERMQQVLAPRFCACDFGLPESTRSAGGRFTGVSVGEVDVFQYRGTGVQTARRRPRHIAADGRDDYLVYLPHSALVDMEQDGRVSQLAPDSFALVATSRPFAGRARTVGSRGAFASTHLRLPGRVLRAEVPGVDERCNRPLAVTKGAPRLLATLATAAFEEAATLDVEMARALADTLLELVAASLRPTAAAPSGHTPSQARARAYIVSQLADPTLGPARIAAACGISVRALHLAFAGSGTTVAACIRAERLARCRRALRDPRQAGRRVIDIALDWGYTDPAHFSRLYRAHYGVSPTADRAAADQHRRPPAR